MNPIELNLFSSRLESICEQMGEVLRQAAFSPNIRDRLDYSCAIFDAAGKLSSQAAHIPVHLGSMAFALADVVNSIDWQEGDQVIFNDPYLGGTHLPDVTMVAPVFHQQQLVAFVVNRAHHADIGASTPGSMPVSSSLHEEGLVLAPVHYLQAGEYNQQVVEKLIDKLSSTESAGDFAAQVSANHFAVAALQSLINKMDLDQYQAGLYALNDYAYKLSTRFLEKIPQGVYTFEDVMDDDGQQNQAIKIRLTLTIRKKHIVADFHGTAPQVAGNINCPLSVAAAAVYYVFRCLMPEQTPACAGAFEMITLKAPLGSLLNAQYPAAVAAGNVETSTRIVDVVLGALGQAIPELIPAASHGSMNNVSMGGVFEKAGTKNRWHYYETIGGGMGAGEHGGGLSAVQTHMTNTLNTPVEVLETEYPLRVETYAVRVDSGGKGGRPGGNGLVRSFRFLAPAHVSVLTERRHVAPWGRQGGEDGALGENWLNGKLQLAKFQGSVNPGDLLQIHTPGGGGFGSLEK